MNLFLYKSLLFLYRAATWLASPFHSKATKLLKGKSRWRRQVQKSSKPTFWMHCASLGEFEQGRTVLETFRKKYPDWHIVLTFFSSTGMEHTKGYEHADVITYLPWDSKKNAQDFYDMVNPSLVCFVKYEFWYFFLQEGWKRSVPIFLVSGIFRKNQMFFKWYGGLYRRMLHFFAQILVQNVESKELLNNIGYTHVEITGDSRIDRVIEIAKRSTEIPVMEKSRINKKILIVGSAWNDDLEVLLPVLNDPAFNLFAIIAPHEIKKKEIEQLKSQLSGNVELFSDIETVVDPSTRCLIIDSIGLLSSLYQYGDIAYIGGAFGDGLHNILEPAVFGLPILFGDKYYDKFQEALDLLHAGGAVAIGNSPALKMEISKLVNEDALFHKRSNLVKSYVKSNEGATDSIIENMEKFL